MLDGLKKKNMFVDELWGGRREATSFVVWVMGLLSGN